MFPTPKNILKEKRRSPPIVPNISLLKNQNLISLLFFLFAVFFSARNSSRSRKPKPCRRLLLARTVAVVCACGRCMVGLLAQPPCMHAFACLCLAAGHLRRCVERLPWVPCGCLRPLAAPELGAGTSLLDRLAPCKDERGCLRFLSSASPRVW
jgi:hypothetical protein